MFKHVIHKKKVQCVLLYNLNNGNEMLTLNLTQDVKKVYK